MLLLLLLHGALSLPAAAHRAPMLLLLHGVLSLPCCMASPAWRPCSCCSPGTYMAPMLLLLLLHAPCGHAAAPYWRPSAPAPARRPMALLTHWRAPCCSPTATLRYPPTPCLPLLRTPILPLYGAPILLLLLLQGRPVSPLLPLHGGPPMLLLLLLHTILCLPCCRPIGRPLMGLRSAKP